MSVKRLETPPVTMSRQLRLLADELDRGEVDAVVVGWLYPYDGPEDGPKPVTRMCGPQFHYIGLIDRLKAHVRAVLS